MKTTRFCYEYWQDKSLPPETFWPVPSWFSSSSSFSSFWSLFVGLIDNGRCRCYSGPRKLYGPVLECLQGKHTRPRQPDSLVDNPYSLFALIARILQDSLEDDAPPIHATPLSIHQALQKHEILHECFPGP